MELERPEDEPLPGDWKRMPEFERLLIFRTLRPDRLTAAMQRFVANTIGKEYTSSQQFDLERSYQVCSAAFHWAHGCCTFLLCLYRACSPR